MQAIPARCGARARRDAKARCHASLNTGSSDTRFDASRSDTGFDAGSSNSGGIDSRSEPNARRARRFCKFRAEGSRSDSRWR